MEIGELSDFHLKTEELKLSAEFLEQNGYKDNLYYLMDVIHLHRQKKYILNGVLEKKIKISFKVLKQAIQGRLLIEYFKDKAEIMIATEAAAEVLI